MERGRSVEYFEHNNFEVLVRSPSLNRVRVEWNQGTGWSRDLHLGINNIQIKKAMRLDEITKGVTVDGEEKRSWN